MKKKIISLCAALCLITGMVVTAGVSVSAAEGATVDGSRLTHEGEATGYATSITKGADLLVGYSKIVEVGKGKIYAGGTTVADHTVESVQVSVMIERTVGNGAEWDFVNSWHKEAKNDERVSDSRPMDVEGGYYYRVRSIHSAGRDMSSSFTDGIYIE